MELWSFFCLFFTILGLVSPKFNLLEFGIFLERGDVTLFQKFWGTFFLHLFVPFLKKIGEDNQNSKVLRNVSLSKIWLKKKFLKGFKNTREEAIWTFSNQKKIFYVIISKRAIRLLDIILRKCVFESLSNSARSFKS